MSTEGNLETYQRKGCAYRVYELNKEQFGAFVSRQRKEKGLTQRELAQRLFVSDKAVSKWERGLSIPDTALLVPLAQALGVTVTELLEGREMERSEQMDPAQVETIVKKALTISEDDAEAPRGRRWRRGLFMGACILAGGLTLLIGYARGLIPERTGSVILTVTILSAVFGVYFWVFARERLPRYYDENRISAYSDGVFRMNLPGISFNNSNWPHIVRVGRWWCAATAAAMPAAGMLFVGWFPGLWNTAAVQIGLTLLYLAGLFVPMVIVGKKYE